MGGGREVTRQRRSAHRDPRGGWLWLAAAAWFVVVYKVGVDNVILVTFRQRVTPDRLLGRQNATMRFLLTGALAIGAALAGVLAELFGIRVALWVGACVLALVWIPLLRSAPHLEHAMGPASPAN